MRHFIAFCLILFVLLAVSCSKEHTNLPVGFKYDPPETPTDLRVTSEAENAILNWSYPEGMMDSVEEFRVYYYLQGYDLIELIATTTDTTFVDSMLIVNMEYCYKVSAVDTTGFEGYRTDSVCEVISSSP